MITKTRPLTNLRRGETVLLFPSYGRLMPDGRTWKVNVNGAVIEPDHVRMHKRLLLRLLKRVIKAPVEDFQSDIFQERIRPFTAATERGRQIAVRVGTRIYRLQKKSKRNGHFFGTLRLDSDDIARLEQDGYVKDGCLRLDVVTNRLDDCVVSGRAHLIDPIGVSVITDIDDTIKHSEVTSRRALLANTFLQEFKPIDGMAELYQSWAQRGAMFHYVSSSPWQLFDPLTNLLDDVGFPVGSIHLRNFRLRDHMMRRVLIIRRRGKGVVIRSILNSFPQRRFILIGDSGERDPELYAAITRKHRRQIAGIFIRDLSERPLSDERCRKAFRQLTPDFWKSFHDADELAECLSHVG